MRRINSIRFQNVPDEAIDLSMGEYYFHDNCHKRAKVFPMAEHFKIRDRVYIAKDENCYKIFYSNRPADQHFKPVIILNKGEYGRIVYNEREVTFDGEWFYIRRTINFVYSDISKFRSKIFFRKDTDFLFEDMDYLRYCGDYHKV